MLLAALALLLALGVFAAGLAALLQVTQHFLQLGQFALGVGDAVFAIGLAQAFGAAVDFALVGAVLRQFAQAFGIFALQALGHGFEMAPNCLAQFLDAALGLLAGGVVVLALLVLPLGILQRLAQGLLGLGQGAGGAAVAAFFQRQSHIP